MFSWVEWGSWVLPSSNNILWWSVRCEFGQTRLGDSHMFIYQKYLLNLVLSSTRHPGTDSHAHAGDRPAAEVWDRAFCSPTLPLSIPSHHTTSPSLSLLLFSSLLFFSFLFFLLSSSSNSLPTTWVELRAMRWVCAHTLLDHIFQKFLDTRPSEVLHRGQNTWLHMESRIMPHYFVDSPDAMESESYYTDGRMESRITRCSLGLMAIFLWRYEFLGVLVSGNKGGWFYSCKLIFVL